MRHARFALSHPASAASESPSNDFVRVNPHERAPSRGARARVPNTHSDCNHAGAGGKRREERAPGPRVPPRRRSATAAAPCGQRRRQPRATTPRISTRARCAVPCRPWPSRRCARTARTPEGCRTSDNAGRRSDGRTAHTEELAAVGVEPSSARRRCPALRRPRRGRSSRRRWGGRDRRAPTGCGRRR
jgi:hypothetical protein